MIYTFISILATNWIKLQVKNHKEQTINLALFKKGGRTKGKINDKLNFRFRIGENIHTLKTKSFLLCSLFDKVY